MKKKLALGVVVLSVVAYVAMRRGHHESGETTVDNKVVLDRIWIDHVPRNERDMINIFVAITEQPFGIFDTNSQWKGSFELFQYEAHGDEMRVVYGQTGEKETIKARAAKCDDNGFDYCLQLGGASRGVKKYYSMEDWVIDGSAIDEHALRDRVAKLIKE
jgi:hypothetical protein